MGRRESGGLASDDPDRFSLDFGNVARGQRLRLRVEHGRLRRRRLRVRLRQAGLHRGEPGGPRRRGARGGGRAR